MKEWAHCIVYRLKTKRTFEQKCRRAGFRLDGMNSTLRQPTVASWFSARDIKVVQNRELVSELQIYRTVTTGVIHQNDKLLPIRESVLNTGVQHGLARFFQMPLDDSFHLVASEPQLAAAIRLQASFAIFHQGEIETADARAAELQSRHTDYLETHR